MQARYASAKVENLARKLEDDPTTTGFERGTETDWKIETVAAMREMIRYINMLERKIEQCEVDVRRRPRFF